MRHGADSTQRFDDLVAVIESTRALASAVDTRDAMSLFARELTLLFDASVCLISSYDPETQRVTDWAAHVVPPATINSIAQDYELSDFPATERVIRDLVSMTTTIGDDGDPAEHALLDAHAGAILDESTALALAPNSAFALQVRAASKIETGDNRGATADEDAALAIDEHIDPNFQMQRARSGQK